MGIFNPRRSRVKYSIIKLYKIVDFTDAKNIDVVGTLMCCLDYTFKLLSSHPDRHEINFGKKIWKSKRSFETALSKLKGVDIFDFTASFSDSKSALYFENSILNISSSSLPTKSMASIEIALPSSSINFSHLSPFFSDLFAFFQFEYGYVVELAEDYDFGTERKIKKKLFGQEISINQIDRVWRFHSVGINYGFLKNVYPVNILNSSQLSQQIINNCINERIGEIYKINSGLSLWTLNESEVNQVLDSLKKTKYLIANMGGLECFLESSESKEFFSLMKVG